MSMSLREFVFASRSPDDANWRERRTPVRIAPRAQSVVTDIEDAVLLERLRAENDTIASEAFSILFLRHTPKMFVAARRGACEGDIAQADDAVQAVMIRIWERRKELPPINDVQGYLVRAAGRECFDRRRAHARAAVRDAQGGTVDNGEADTPETFVAEHDLLMALQCAIGALPGRMGDLFRAWYSTGASYEAVAAKFGVTPQAVARARLRAVAQLRTDPALARFWRVAKED